MLRAIGRVLREFATEALEGSTNRGASWLHVVGQVVYSLTRSDREISDAVALAVAVGTLIVALMFLVLLRVVVVGVFSWLSDLQSQRPNSSDDPQTPDSDEGPRSRLWAYPTPAWVRPGIDRPETHTAAHRRTLAAKLGTQRGLSSELSQRIYESGAKTASYMMRASVS